jgi:hypothetical protein
MAAALRFFAADGTTVITSLYLGSVGSPGASGSQQVILENFGDGGAANLSLSIQPVPNVDGSEWGLIAPDVGGSPGTFVAGPLSLATLQPNERVAFWTKSSVSSGQAAQAIPRRYQIVASGVNTSARPAGTLSLKASIRVLPFLQMRANIHLNQIDQTNLIWWFKADNVGFAYTDGAAMTSGWKDSTAHHYDATTPVAAPSVNPGVYHATGVNGLPYVSIASNQGFDIPFGNIPTPVSSQDLTFYFVSDYTLPLADLGGMLNLYEDPEIIMIADAPADFYGPGDPPTDSLDIETTDASGFNNRHTTAAAASGLQVITCVINGTAGTISWYRNGTLLVNEASAMWALTHTLGNDTIELFHFASSLFFVGKQCEHAAYSVAHDATEVASNASVLMGKWGI